jgi:hypothetical protein
MTRKRTRENLVQQLCEPCSYCDGRGYVISAESVAYKVLREIRKDMPRFCGRQIAVSVNPRVAEMLLGPVRKATQRLSADVGREIEIRARPGLHQEQFEVVALDQGPAVEIPLRWLEGEPRGKREERRLAEPAAEEVVETGDDAPKPDGKDPEAADPEGEYAPKPDVEPAAAAVDGNVENLILPRFQRTEE